MLARIIPLAVILSLLSAICPAPALATSTATEIQMGQAEDQQIVESSVMETDPLLNAYVQGIAENLWNQVARKDVPYSIKIIKANDVNSFATLGGFVYVYEGLIDFTQSDDELASVIGHETGHIERRHLLTANAKAQALNILFGIASLFSPLIYNFGGLAEAGIMAKISRSDELQADRYGLQLMSRAGYDPHAMTTMMQHLMVLESGKSDLVTKYLEDHPEPDARVAHLVGYPELDPKLVTPAQELVQASSDEERARYDYASTRLEKILKDDPTNGEALLELGQAQLALGLTSKSEQTLAEAAQNGSPETRATANQKILALRQLETQRVTLTKQPNLNKLQTIIVGAQSSQAEAAAQIQARAQEGRDQFKSINARIDALQYEIPDFSRINIKRGSRIEALVKNLSLMSRSINSTLDDTGAAIGGVGSLEPNKETGLLKDGADIYKEMLRPFSMAPIPGDALALLPQYPAMVNELSLADSDMLRSVDAGRASLTMLDQSVGDLDEFLKNLNQVRVGYNGDIDTRGVQPARAADAAPQRRVQQRGRGRVADVAALQPRPLAAALGAHHAARLRHVAGTLRDAAIRAAAALRNERHRLSHDAARRPDAGRRYRGDDSRRRHQEHARSGDRRSQEFRFDDRRRRQRARHARVAARNLLRSRLSRLHRQSGKRTAPHRRRQRRSLKPHGYRDGHGRSIQSRKKGTRRSRAR